MSSHKSRNSKSYSLQTMFPEVASEWHESLNGKLTPSMVKPRIFKMIWWRCKKVPEHEWEAFIGNRTRKSGGGCPFCSNKRVHKTNCLATTHPELIKEWYTAKNLELGLSPEQLTAGSKVQAWWRCLKNENHTWQAAVNSKVKAASGGCPYCRGLRVSPENCLATLYPHLAEEWHKTKNENLTASDVTAASNKRVWWQCRWSEHHQWKIDVAKRTLEKTGCPFCANRKITVDNNFAFFYPSLTQYWNYERNNGLRPDQIAPKTTTKYWWRCSVGHEFRSSPSKMIRSKEEYGTAGCLQCAVESRKGGGNLKKRMKVSTREAHMEHISREEDEDFSTKKNRARKLID